MKYYKVFWLKTPNRDNWWDPNPYWSDLNMVFMHMQFLVGSGNSGWLGEVKEMMINETTKLV